MRKIILVSFSNSVPMVNFNLAETGLPKSKFTTGEWSDCFCTIKGELLALRQVNVAVGNHELYKYYDLAKMPRGLVCSIRDNVKCYYDAVVRVENVDFIISTLCAKILL